MTRDITTGWRRSAALGVAATFGVLLLVSPASAEDDSEQRYHDLTTHSSTVELGTLYNSADEFKFGDFTGLTDKGWSVLGNTDFRRRSPFDAERPYYYRLMSQNLGLDSRLVEAEYQWPGLFGVSFLFDEMPKYTTDSAQTFFLNTGSQFLQLPPGWVPGSNPTPGQMPELEANLRNLQIDFKRRTLGGGVSLVLPGGFDMDASYSHQTKRGERLVGATFGLTGGNPRAVVVPEPIEYTTQQIDSHIRYANEIFQGQLEYYGSGFDNDTELLAWENPYTAGPLNPVVGFPTGIGQKAQMPDNWFHQISGSGGVMLPLNSRFMANAAFGWGTQRDDYLPYTVNSLLAAPLGLPRNDLNGKMKTRLVTVQLVSNPLPKFGTDFKYRWSQRDNDSPVDTYFRVVNDSGDQDPDNARINRPYSFEQHQANANFSYEVYKRTKLTLMYEWDRMKRNLQEVKQNDEHTFGAKLISHPSRYVNGGVRYERGYKNGDEYNCVRPLIATEPAALLDDPGCPLQPGSDQEFENQPLLRKYYMANRHRNDAYAWLNITPIDTLSIGVNVRYRDDDFYDTVFGVTSYRLLTPGFDVSWWAAEGLQFNTFYNYGKTKTNMTSVSFGVNTDASYDPDNYWWSEDKDINHTVGAGMEWQAIPERLTVGADYLFAWSRGNIVTRTATGGPLLPFPDPITKLHDISLFGEIQITRNVALRLGYLFEKYNSSDWATEKVCPACLTFSGNAAVIASGENSPDYRAHVGSMSVIFEFW